MSHWEIYLLTRLTPINVLLTFIATISTIVLGTIIAVWIEDNDETYDEYKVIKHMISKKFILLGMASTLLLWVSVALLPTTKQAAAIYLIPKIVNNERICNMADNELKIVESETHQYLKEIAPNLKH